MHYFAFGESIETQSDDVGYTGHKFDADTGLSYMQARYYDPVIGRFYSNDPVGFTNVHTFNRYAYANNNPYKYTDPNGQTAAKVVGSFKQWAKGWKDLGNSMTQTAQGVKQGAKQLGNSTIKAANDTVTAATNPENLKAASSSLGDIAVVATALGQPEIAVPAAIASTALGFAAASQAENPLEAIVIEGVVNHMAKPIGFVAKIGGKNAEGFVKDGIEALGVAGENKYKDEIKKE